MFREMSGCGDIRSEDITEGVRKDSMLIIFFL